MSCFRSPFAPIRIPPPQGTPLTLAEKKALQATDELQFGHLLFGKEWSTMDRSTLPPGVCVWYEQSVYVSDMSKMRGFKLGKVTPEPMNLPVSSIFFLDYDYGGEGT